MIIVSQDKTKIINFNNVGNVNIEKCYNESLKKEAFRTTFWFILFQVDLLDWANTKQKKEQKKCCKK